MSTRLSQTHNFANVVTVSTEQTIRDVLNLIYPSAVFSIAVTANFS